MAHEHLLLLALATSENREILGRLSAALDGGLIGDALAVENSESGIIATKVGPGQGSLCEIGATTARAFCTVIPSSSSSRGSRPTVDVHSILEASECSSVEVIAERREDGPGALETATIVIGVGDGVPPDSYGLIRELAAALNAELGATRRVTDRGLLPRTRQIGATGRRIAPDLYVALGISGRTHHTVGMAGAKNVVAINLDPSAEIFHHCDVAIVSDVILVVPAILAELRRWRTQRAEEPPSETTGLAVR